jgi:hypothetical protein
MLFWGVRWTYPSGAKAASIRDMREIWWGVVFFREKWPESLGQFRSVQCPSKCKAQRHTEQVTAFISPELTNWWGKRTDKMSETESMV